MGILKSLSPGDYHVVLVSPETFTTFTPLLPCMYDSPSHAHSFVLLLSQLLAAAVGTVQVRSLIEPLRKIVARLRGHYVCGKAIDLVMGERLLEVETIGTDGIKRNIYIPYVTLYE